MLQSIDFDGTGMGIDLKIVEEIKKLDVTCPIILKVELENLSILKKYY